MGRVFGLILVACGGLMLFSGVGLTIVLLVRPGRKDGLIVSVPLAAIGLGVLIAGIVILRRSRPLGMPSATTDGRFRANTPVPGQLNDQTFVTLYSPPVKGKHARPSALRVSVPAPDLPDLRITNETGFDRFAKRYGLATEIDTGDETFDPLCYVTTDAVGFVAAYLADPVKRLGVLDLRRMGFTELEGKAGQLTAVWTGFNPAAHDRPDLESETAARLLVLTQDLPDATTETLATTGRGRRAWSWVLWLLALGYGATFFAGIPFTPMRGWQVALWVGGVLLILAPLIALGSAVLLRGTSSSHRAWAALMAACVPLIPAGTVGTVRLLNAVLDQSPAVEHTAEIVGTRQKKKKNGMDYYVVCRSWRADADTEEFEVSKFDHDRVAPGRSKFVVTTRAGRLGIEWVNGTRIELK
jgi:hypothetical protein